MRYNHDVCNKIYRVRLKREREMNEKDINIVGKNRSMMTIKHDGAYGKMKYNTLGI